jgi:chromosome segregation ATPase
MEVILAENEQLRASQLENLRKASRDPESFSAPLNEELLNEMNERIEILMAENALMVEQKSMLNNEFSKLQTDYEKCEDELSDLAQKYNSVRQELADVAGRIPQAERDRDRATNEVSKASEALGKAEAEVDELREQFHIWRDNCKKAEEALQETRKNLKALSDKSEEEGFSCVRRTKAAEDRVRELHGLLHAKTQELESVQEVVRKLRREYQSTRQDAEGMLQVMGGLERQLSDYAGREAEVERLTKECKDKIEEAMIARDQVKIGLLLYGLNNLQFRPYLEKLNLREIMTVCLKKEGMKLK